MRFFHFATVGLVCGSVLVGACSSSDGSGAGAGSSADGGAITPGGPGTTFPGSTAIVTTTTESMTVNGRARVYILKVPTSIDKTKTYPLVMDLHGSPGDAAGQAGDGFENTTGQTAIIVYPQALAEDSGAWSWDLSNVAADNQDVAMLEALPAELAKKGLTIDPAKVFGYGYSGGGFFLQVYQCLGAKVYRAIAASAGGSPDSLSGSIGTYDDDAKCVKCPGTPVPELIIFGALDESKGGDYQAQCQAQVSGCSQTLTQTTPTACKKYDGCPADRPVEYCSVEGLGHGTWSEAVSTSWGFFKTYL